MLPSLGTLQRGDKRVRVGVLFIRLLVISFIYIREVIVTKAFLAKGTTNFSFGLRAITAVSETCWDFIPFRVADKILFSNVLTLGYVTIIFRPSKSVLFVPRMSTSQR